MIPFLALVRKDLKLFVNDRKALIVSLLVPIVLASFFGYLFGGQGGNAETSKVAVLVIDQDSSDISRALVTQLADDKTLDVKPSDLDARTTGGAQGQGHRGDRDSQRFWCRGRTRLVYWIDQA